MSRTLVSGVARLALLALTLVIASTGTAFAQASPSVTLTATPQTARVGDTIQLTAESSGGTVYIYDIDTGRLISSCSSRCTRNDHISWAENANPRTRNYRADLRSPSTGELRATSSVVTVPVERYDFTVALAAAQPTVRIPGSIELQVSVDRTASKYALYVIDDNTGATVFSCTNACSRYVHTSYADNVAALARRFHAEYRSPTDLGGTSDPITVPVLRRRYDVNLTFEPASYDSSGGVTGYAATATTADALGPYRLIIRNQDGAVMRSCTLSPCTTTVPFGSYRASVEDDVGREFGSSSSWTLAASQPPREEAADGIDLVALATLWARSTDPCLALAGFPGATNTSPPSSLNDYQKACELMRAEGRPPLEMLRELIKRTPAVAGTSLAWWLAYQETADAPTWTPPWPPPWDPPYGDAAREAARRGLGPALGATATALLGYAAVRYALDQAQADAIARKCLEYTARAGFNGHGECARTPIFASGADVPEVTSHDIDALTSHAAWVLLNYEESGAKPGRDWTSDHSDCTSRQPGQHCHEYPFFGTDQGGPLAAWPPRVKPVDGTQNTSQGGMYSQFARTRCKLTTGTPQAGSNSVGGDPFLSIPLPPELGIPTWYGCKTAPT